MSATLMLVNLVGDVVLLLWGMRMVHRGIVRAYGSGLRRVLAVGLKNRFAAMLAGALVTALLQSSTATAIMTTSFAAGGVVDLVPALAIMLGANIGTTLIVKVLSFDISWVAPLLLTAGYVAFTRARKTRAHDLGRVGIGLGLMLLGLHLLILTIEPAEGAPMLRDLLAALTGEPVLNLLIAAALTLAAHSSVAAMLLIVSLASAHVLTPLAALTFVLGANLGATIPPVLAASGPNPADRRLPVGNLAIRAAGCLVMLPLLHPVAVALGAFEPDPGRLAVDFHIGFNVALGALFIFLLDPIARLLGKLLPAKAKASDPARPQYLDETVIDTPYLALANAARETLRMADIVDAMLRGSRGSLLTNDRKLVAEIYRMGKGLDRLHEAVKRYLTRVADEALSDDDARRCRDIMAFAVNLGHAGDVVERSLVAIAGKKLKKNVSFSAEDAADTAAIHARVLENLRLALSTFMSEDRRSARELLTAKRRLNELEHAATENHLARLRASHPEHVEASTLHLAVLRDLKRVNSHVSAIAYTTLEAFGELAEKSVAKAEPERGQQQVSGLSH